MGFLSFKDFHAPVEIIISLVVESASLEHELASQQRGWVLDFALFVKETLASRALVEIHMPHNRLS